VKSTCRYITAVMVAIIMTSVLSCGPSLEDYLREYELSHNSHDTEKTLSFLAEDVRYEMVGNWIAEGRHEMRRFEEWDSATSSHIVYVDIHTNENVLMCKVIERNDWFSLLGIEAIYYDSVRITYEDGLISEIVSQQSAESMIAARTAFESFILWAARERPYDLAELMRGIEFVFSGENAGRWLKLLREWREANKPERVA